MISLLRRPALTSHGTGPVVRLCWSDCGVIIVIIFISIASDYPFPVGTAAYLAWHNGRLFNDLSDGSSDGEAEVGGASASARPSAKAGAVNGGAKAAAASSGKPKADGTIPSQVGRFAARSLSALAIRAQQRSPHAHGTFML